MPSKLTVQRPEYKRWVPPYWEFPTTSPTEDNPRYQAWTNDLLLSGGNHGYEVRNGLLGAGAPDLGGTFLAHKRSYEENILGNGGAVHFSWSMNPEDTASPYYLTNQWPYKDEFNSSAFPLPEATDDLDLQGLGTTAIARCKPTKPMSDLSTFIGEAREGIPSMVGLSLTGKARARQARNAGDEYLNVEFGWKPLLRDVRSFLNAYRNSKRALDAYHAGAGKLIRRKYRFPTELEVTEESMGYRFPVPILHPSCYRTGGLLELTLTKSVKVERWFSGSFIYDVPRRSDPYSHIDDANYLYGVEPTPETLWNLAPWSWAADWVGNIGDNISNMIDFLSDGLVLHHAYMMEHKTTKYTYSMHVPANYWHSHRAERTLSQTFTAETKKRIQASPYGFATSWDDFTSKQLAILGSLGISRAK